MAIWLPIWHIVVPTATATFATSNETFSVSQTPSLSWSKVEDIEEESPKRKESISGNRIIDVNILLVVFLVRCSVLNVWVQFISSLWKIWEKTSTIIIVVLKMLSCKNSLLQQKYRGFEINQQTVWHYAIVSWPWLCWNSKI